MVSFASGTTSVVDGGASIIGDDHVDVLRWSFLCGHSRLLRNTSWIPLSDFAVQSSQIKSSFPLRLQLFHGLLLTSLAVLASIGLHLIVGPASTRNIRSILGITAFIAYWLFLGRECESIVELGRQPTVDAGSPLSIVLRMTSMRTGRNYANQIQLAVRTYGTPTYWLIQSRIRECACSQDRFGCHIQPSRYFRSNEPKENPFVFSLAENT